MHTHPLQDQDKNLRSLLDVAQHQKTGQKQNSGTNWARGNCLEGARRLSLAETYHEQHPPCWGQPLGPGSGAAPARAATPARAAPRMPRRRRTKRKRLVWIWNAHHSVSGGFQESQCLDSLGWDAVWLVLLGRSSLGCPWCALGLWALLLSTAQKRGSSEKMSACHQLCATCFTECCKQHIL